MAETETKKPEPTRPAAPTTTLRKFQAPDKLDKSFGVLHATEEHIQGLILTEDIPDLLDSFGVPPSQHLSFPYQYAKRQHGEIWRLRIEDAGIHTVGGRTSMAHQWSFTQDYPERSAPAQ